MSEDSDAKTVKTAEEAYAAAVAEAPPAEKPVEAEAAPAELAAPEVAPRATKSPRAPKAVAAPEAAPAPKAKTLRKAAKRKAAPATPKPTKRKYVRKAAAPVPKAKIAPAKPQPSKVKAPTAMPSVKELKEKIMATAKKTKPEYAKLLETAQTKAKAAYAQGASVAAKVGAFSKGNVEAVVASSKILGEGVKALGKDYVAESKGAFETLTGDLKAFAAVRSPTELFQLQGKLARRNFDSAVAYGSKTSESLVKLANEVFAPISNRVSLAVDKVSKAA